MDIKLRLSEIEKQLEDSKQSEFYIDLKESMEDQFSAISGYLRSITKPVIYWFECENENDAKDLNTLYNMSKVNLKSVPPVNGHISKVLYLGVRQGGVYKRPSTMSRIQGRIYHHFGLYKVESTQGLKLSKWATVSGLKIKLTVIELNIKENQYLYIIEKLYSLELKPMFGKH